jgi:hypothetical protein
LWPATDEEQAALAAMEETRLELLNELLPKDEVDDRGAVLEVGQCACVCACVRVCARVCV